MDVVVDSALAKEARAKRPAAVNPNFMVMVIILLFFSSNATSALCTY